MVITMADLVISLMFISTSKLILIITSILMLLYDTTLLIVSVIDYRHDITPNNKTYILRDKLFLYVFISIIAWGIMAVTLLADILFVHQYAYAIQLLISITIIRFFGCCTACALSNVCVAEPIHDNNRDEYTSLYQCPQVNTVCSRQGTDNTTFETPSHITINMAGSSLPIQFVPKYGAESTTTVVNYQ
jgi:hypothetical protein